MCGVVVDEGSGSLEDDDSVAVVMIIGMLVDSYLVDDSNVNGDGEMMINIDERMRIFILKYSIFL